MPRCHGTLPTSGPQALEANEALLLTLLLLLLLLMASADSTPLERVAATRTPALFGMLGDSPGQLLLSVLSTEDTLLLLLLFLPLLLLAPTDSPVPVHMAAIRIGAFCGVLGTSLAQLLRSRLGTDIALLLLLLMFLLLLLLSATT
jgi:hypothetical protein